MFEARPKSTIEAQPVIPRKFGDFLRRNHRFLAQLSSLDFLLLFVSRQKVRGIIRKWYIETMISTGWFRQAGFDRLVSTSWFRQAQPPQPATTTTTTTTTTKTTTTTNHQYKLKSKRVRNINKEFPPT